VGRKKQTLYVLVWAWAFVSLLDSGLCFGGPNLVAVGYYDLPRLRAEGRYSFDGKTVIFEFPGEHDFGRVLVRASTPRSIIRRDMEVYYSGRSLVVNLGEASLNDPQVWIEFDLKGEIRPGRTYEYEIDGGSDPEIKGGVPTIMPAMWVDGKPMGATVLLKNPIRTGEIIQRQLYAVRGTVDIKHFEQTTGKASIVVKLPENFSGLFAVARLMFREIDEEIVEGRTPEMPVPLRYIPIRTEVERLINDALKRTKDMFKRTQNRDGYWDVGDLEPSIWTTATIVAALAEMGEPTDDEAMLKAMRWLAQTPARTRANEPATAPRYEPGQGRPSSRSQPRGPTRREGGGDRDDEETLYVETVAARLYCLARYGSKSEFGRTIAEDVEFLTDAQYPDGGWANVSPTDQPRAAARVHADHSVSFAVVRALREAIFAEVPCDRRVWIDAGKYWVEAQAKGAPIRGDEPETTDGGFRQKLERYGGAGEATTIGRTAQGVMSLIATLEMAHGPGSHTRSCEQYRGNRPQIRGVERGLTWLDRFYGEEYKFSGGLGGQATPYEDAWALQMCGAVSGIHRFNDLNHFRDQARRLLDPEKQRYNRGTGLFSNNFLATALASLTLSSGASPTVFQRVVLGGSEASAAELSGDAQHLVRYLMRQRNKPLNWRRSTMDTPQGMRQHDHVRDWLEVPMLYLNVAGPVTWEAEDSQKLRAYCYNGGVVIINIGRMYEGQRAVVMSGLRQAFPEYEAREISADHPLYAAREGIEEPLKVKAIGNGVKDFVYIFQEDWSCVFHMYDVKDHPEAFAFVNNLLEYTMDGAAFRSSFDQSTYPSGAAASREVRVARIEIGGDLPVYPELLKTLDLSMQTNYRLNVVDVGEAEAPLLWVSITGDSEISAEHKQQIMKHIRAGGYLLVDVVTGKEDWAEAAESAFRGLDPAVTLRNMRSMHPVYTGKIGGTRGFDLRAAPMRKSLARKFVNAGRNEFLTILYKGEEVGALSAWDIASGVGYNLYPECRGLRAEASRELAMNVVLYAMQREFQR